MTNEPAHELVLRRPLPAQRQFLSSPAKIRLYIGGLGAGKTISGTFAIAGMPAGSRGLIVAPTYPMLRDIVCKELESVYGPLVRIKRADMVAEWPASGITALLRSAEKPDRLRGPNIDWAWGDEAAMYSAAAVTQIISRVRQGESRSWFTTTPRKGCALYDILVASEDPDVAQFRSRTADNRHLPPDYEPRLRRIYSAALAAQELDAEWIDVTGGLWQDVEIPRIERYRQEDVIRWVIGVDPAATARDDSDETGIILAALHRNRDDGSEFVVVHHDWSGRYSPGRWAEIVCDYARRYKATVVIEVNQGGDMVAHTLRTAWAEVPIQEVRATTGKALRADPVVAMYEQGRVRHLGEFPKLETQMRGWDPSGSRSSPDRLDALVWAVYGLGITAQEPSAHVRVHGTPLHRQTPQTAVRTGRDWR